MALPAKAARCASGIPAAAATASTCINSLRSIVLLPSVTKCGDSFTKKGGPKPPNRCRVWPGVGYLLTGELGSSSSATKSRTWSCVKMPLVPARGILEQAL